MKNYKENYEFWVNLARTFNDRDNSTARNCEATKIKKESSQVKVSKNILMLIQAAQLALPSAIYPDSDDDLTDSLAQSGTSCDQMQQLEKQLRQQQLLCTDNMTPGGHDRGGDRFTVQWSV